MWTQLIYNHEAIRPIDILDLLKIALKIHNF